jgi:steroid delta-isomerase-like uncharacterized protein
VEGAVIAERVELQAAYLGAWNAHDPQAVAAFFEADAVYADHGAGTEAVGYEAILRHVEDVVTAFPDLEFELLKSTHGPDFTCGEWRARMTHRGELFGLAPTGRRLESSGVDVATLNPEGMLIRVTSYYDGAAIMRQLGLLPGRGTRAERLLLRAASLLPKRP